MRSILKTLPKMAQAAKHAPLKQAFDVHRTQTEGQIQRLQEVFSLVDLNAEGVPCEAIQGILAERSEVMEKFGPTCALANPARPG
jgi:ferritin-like metal-binding protein YciE